MKYTMEQLHKMDPAKIISYDGRRPMQVNEVIQRLIHDNWPDETPVASKGERSGQ